MKFRIILSGAATLVGAELLRELRQRSDVGSILVLTPTDESAGRRYLADLQDYLGALPESIRILPTDVRLPRFGLSLSEWQELAASFDLAFHCAQREIKDANLEVARQANVRPVENWIELLSHNPDLRLNHLSTGFVGGTRVGLLTEFDLDCGQGFHNAWERSKFEAEVRIRESVRADRITVYRPSHVLGCEDDGEALNLGGAYPLLASLAAARILPGDSRARIDFVPADYVAKVMATLGCAGARGTFHIACGWDTSIQVEEAATIVARAHGRSRRARFLPRAFVWPLRPAGSKSLGGLSSRSLAFSTARDLLSAGPVFDTYLADLALAGTGIKRPRPEIWLERAVQKAAQRSWTAPALDELDIPARTASLPSAAAEVAMIRQNPIFREKRFHLVGNVNVAYRDIGAGEPLVLLHGTGGAHAWDAVAQRLAPQRRVLVIETLGLGDSEGDSDSDFGLSAQAAHVRGLLSALEIPQADIVGNEAGGLIAQIFAVRWPQCTRSLVLSDCETHETWPPRNLERLARLARVPGGLAALAVLMKRPSVVRSKRFLGRLVTERRVLTPERIKSYVHTIAGTRVRRLRLKRFLRGMKQGETVTINQLLGLRMPTMIVWGGDNICVSHSWAKLLYDTIPGARRLEVIPFAGSSCHEERPELFSLLVTDFLDQVGARHTAEVAPRVRAAAASSVDATDPTVDSASNRFIF